MQGCKFSGNCLNSGLHEAQIPALLFIFSPFWRLLVQIHTFSGFYLEVSLHPCKWEAGIHATKYPTFPTETYYLPGPWPEQ